jgi:hypothetical protein
VTFILQRDFSLVESSAIAGALVIFLFVTGQKSFKQTPGWPSSATNSDSPSWSPPSFASTKVCQPLFKDFPPLTAISRADGGAWAVALGTLHGTFGSGLVV